eukprot:1404956-Pyramimonas_sp.AAC.1
MCIRDSSRTAAKHLLRATSASLALRKSGKSGKSGIRKSGIALGDGAERQTRKEVFFSSCSSVSGGAPHPRTAVIGHKFERKKKQVDMVIDTHAASVAG